MGSHGRLLNWQQESCTWERLTRASWADEVPMSGILLHLFSYPVLPRPGCVFWASQTRDNFAESLGSQGDIVFLIFWCTVTEQMGLTAPEVEMSVTKTAITSSGRETIVSFLGELSQAEIAPGPHALPPARPPITSPRSEWQTPAFSTRSAGSMSG